MLESMKREKHVGFDSRNDHRSNDRFCTSLTLDFKCFSPVNHFFPLIFDWTSWEFPFRDASRAPSISQTSVGTTTLTTWFWTVHLYVYVCVCLFICVHEMCIFYLVLLSHHNISVIGILYMNENNLSKHIYIVQLNIFFFYLIFVLSFSFFPVIIFNLWLMFYIPHSSSPSSAHDPIKYNFFKYVYSLIYVSTSTYSINYIQYNIHIIFAIFCSNFNLITYLLVVIMLSWFRLFYFIFLFLLSI